MIFHYFPSQLPNCFLGVDLFFVISGFTITHISMSRKFHIFNFLFKKLLIMDITNLYYTSNCKEKMALFRMLYEKIKKQLLKKELEPNRWQN